MLQEKERLAKNNYVYSAFISPSGNGIKALVKIPGNPDMHKTYFKSLEKHFNSNYFDKTSKNLSRVCYESYDPLIHINETSSLWDKVEEQEYQEVIRNVDLPTLPVTELVYIDTRFARRRSAPLEPHCCKTRVIHAPSTQQAVRAAPAKEWQLSQRSPMMPPMG